MEQINPFSKFVVLVTLIGCACHSTAAENLILLDEITVTAERRDKALSALAASVEVINSKITEEQQINQLSDLDNLAANVSVQPSTVFKNITIRGVGGGGRNAGFDTRVGVYIDGVYMGQGIALDNPIFDLDQIEILKGPQGFLFGNNSNAGAINITTKQPTHTREISLNSGVGNFGYFENTLTLNGELSKNLTGRLVIRNDDHNGIVKNNFDGSRLKELWRFATRGQLKLEVSEKFDVNFAIDYTKSNPDTYLSQGQTGFFDLPLIDGPASFDAVNNSYGPYLVNTNQGYHLSANYFFDNDAKLTAIIASRDSNSFSTNDSDYSSLELADVTFKDDIEQYSQELRYTSAEDLAWPFVVGLYFTQSTNTNDRLVSWGKDADTPVALPFAPVPLPFSAAFGIFPGAEFSVFGKVKSNTKAIYTNIDHYFTDRVALHLGGRYSVESKKLNFSIDGSQSGALGLAVIDNEKQRIHDTFFSPMVGVSYHLNQQSHLYTRASRAYKSAGWNVDFVNQAQVDDGIAFKPESVNAYEVGYKFSKPNTQFSAAAFLNYYRHYQIFQLADLGGNTQVLQLRNAASVKTQGLELNLKHLFNQSFNIDAHLGYLDARFEDFTNGDIDGSDADNQRLPNAPKLSGSVTLNYFARFANLAPIQLSLQNNFQSDTHSHISNDPETGKLSGRGITNLFASYQSANKRWELSLWVKNLANKEYTIAKGRDVFRNQVWINALPRMYGINGTYHF